jgi:hypothetical protein
MKTLSRKHSTRRSRLQRRKTRRQRGGSDVLKIYFFTRIGNGGPGRYSRLVGEPFEISVDDYDTLTQDELKKKIEEEKGIPPAQQQFWMGTHFTNTDKFSDTYPRVSGKPYIPIMVKLLTQ